MIEDSSTTLERNFDLASCDNVREDIENEENSISDDDQPEEIPVEHDEEFVEKRKKSMKKVRNRIKKHGFHLGDWTVLKYLNKINAVAVRTCKIYFTF